MIEDARRIEKVVDLSTVSDRAPEQPWVESLWAGRWEREKESKRYW